MTSRTRTRFAGRVVALLALTAPLSATLVMAAPAPAFAGSGSISAPSEPIVSGTAVTVSGTIYTGTASTTLTLSGPGGYASNITIEACPDRTLTSPACSSKSASRTAQLDGRPNGKWTASLSGGAATSKLFYTNFVPTADPANLAAAPNGRTAVDLSWTYGGSEPDKAGFEVVETHAGTSRTLSVPTSACSGTSCGLALTGYSEPAEGTSETYSYTVTALRSSGGCSSCGSATRSGASSSASAQLDGPPPPPSPTPTPSESAASGTTGGTTGTTGGTTGGTTTGTSTGSTTGSTTGTRPGTAGPRPGGTSGTTTGSASRPIAIPTLPPIAASRRAFALGFNRFSPSLGIPKLPPLPATTFPTTAPGTEVYQPTLPYGAQPGKTTTKVMSSPIASITNSIDTEQLAKSLAVALILLVAAAHVRIFLSHDTED